MNYNIEIVNFDGSEVIETIDLPHNPFKVGEVIHINIQNNDPDFDLVEPMMKSFTVEHIEHYFRSTWISKLEPPIERFTTSVSVIETKED